MSIHLHQSKILLLSNMFTDISVLPFLSHSHTTPASRCLCSSSAQQVRHQVRTTYSISPTRLGPHNEHHKHLPSRERDSFHPHRSTMPLSAKTLEHLALVWECFETEPKVSPDSLPKVTHQPCHHAGRPLRSVSHSTTAFPSTDPCLPKNRSTTRNSAPSPTSPAPTPPANFSASPRRSSARSTAAAVVVAPPEPAPSRRRAPRPARRSEGPSPPSLLRAGPNASDARATTTRMMILSSRLLAVSRLGMTIAISSSSSRPCERRRSRRGSRIARRR